MPGGPHTTAGKAVAKMNATEHGLRATTPVLPTESVEEWETHRAAIAGALTPVGALEQSLTERVALLLWRLRRVARYETQMATAAIDAAEEDHAKEQKRLMLFDGGASSRAPAELRREIRRYPASARLLGKLAAMEPDRRISGPDASDILEKCIGRAGYMDDDFDAEAITFVGLPDDLDWDDFPAITAGLLRRHIDAIASAVDSDRATLIAATRRYCEEQERVAKAQLAEVEKAIAHLREDRALPSGGLLEKIQRYETHLHRQLLQTLHELEAIQDRRAGRSSPLARLDVSGLDPSQ